MGLSWKIRRPAPELLPARSQSSISLDQWAGMLQSFGFQGQTYTIPGHAQEEPDGLYSSVVQLAYRTNGIVFACMLVRMMLFAEARFQYRRLRSGRPGELWGDASLGLLEQPWPGGTTGDLMSKAITHADLAGNAFIVRRPGKLVLLRPDWVDILIGSMDSADADVWDVDSEVIGYVYYPGGKPAGKKPVTFLADEVAHFAPVPDPLARYRGMSWLTPILREIMADKAATEHKLAFFENGATVNSVIKTNATSTEKFREYKQLFEEKFAGSMNAYKMIMLQEGWDFTPVGADFEQMDFKQVQGAGETRIAAAAGVPPVIVGLSEGLQAATYSNYGQARRRFADGTMSPLWRNFCGSLSKIIQVPSGSELAVDSRDIPFLREDEKDAAEIQAREATTIRTLVDGGYTPESVTAAVIAGNFSLLVHTGLFSVQLQPPGPKEPPASPPVAPAPAPAGANSSRMTLDELLEEVLRSAERTQPTHNHNTYVELSAPNVEFAEGSMQSHVTVEPARVEAPHIEFADGAIRSEVSVEPARVEFADGAIRVEPAPVTIADGAVRVNVEPPELRVAEGAIQSHVTVEPAQVDVSVERAQVDVHVPDQPPPVVNVEARAAEQLPPVVQVTVEPTPVTVDAPVTVHMPEMQPPDITVNVEAPNKKVRFERNQDGDIVEATTEDADA